MDKLNFVLPLVTRSADDDDGKMIVEGTAVKFDTPNLMYDLGDEKYYEVVSRGACDDVDFSNTILRYNHEDTVPALASARNGSLKVSVSDEALTIRAELAETSVAKDIYELVKSGAAGGLSICFAPEQEHFDENVRFIEKIKIMPEISIVDFPAYGDNTSIAVVRSIEKAKSYKELKNKLIEEIYFK